MYTNLIECLEQIAMKFPNKIVYQDENRSITFSELVCSSKKIAMALIKEGFYKKPIVVFMDKSVKCLECFWGIIYSGNFYTPIDISMPEERIDKIVETLKPVAVISEVNDNGDMEVARIAHHVFSYEEIMKENIIDDAITSVKKKVIDTDILYVLFTSGSTGIPKGVTITHRAVIDFAEAVCRTFTITEKDKIGNQGPFYFDLSVYDIYVPILSGASMVIIPPQHFKFPVRLLEYIRDHEINTIFWVPSALVLVANLRALKAVDISCLKKIMFCGEVMPNKQLNIWRKHLPDAMYVNTYGPTETTCASTYYIVDREFNDEESLPIGRPFCNTDILLLDDDMKPVEKGMLGEICIRGTSVSYGYYGDLQRTSECFVQNPLNKEYIEYIYKTGDLAQYNDNDELIYVTRKDFQIKHMGHRIELGEIEVAITGLEKITSCCCVYDDKRHKIVAYVTDKIENDYIQNECKKLLPNYMIPNQIIYIEQLPLNANGQVDRLKLKKML